MSYELALGPLGPGWPGPQRIALRVSAGRIASLDHRDGYHSRGCAARLQRLELSQTWPLVSRVCGEHSQHHALAWTLAIEALGGPTVPPRATALRTLVAELERAAAHLRLSAELLGLLGLEPAAQRLAGVRETLLDAAKLITGQRLVHDFVLPGGVRHDLHRDETAALAAELAAAEGALQPTVAGLLGSRGLGRRLAGLAPLAAAFAAQFALSGPVIRAAGAADDLRRDQPYIGYAEWAPRPVGQRAGDAQARLFGLLLESYESLQLSQRIVDELPAGLWRGDMPATIPAGTATGAVEAPTGQLRYRLVSDGLRLTTVEITGPALPNHLLLRALLVDQAPEDAPVILASVAACAACAEA